MGFIVDIINYHFWLGCSNLYLYLYHLMRSYYFMLPLQVVYILISFQLFISFRALPIHLSFFWFPLSIKIFFVFRFSFTLFLIFSFSFAPLLHVYFLELHFITVLHHFNSLKVIIPLTFSLDYFQLFYL